MILHGTDLARSVATRRDKWRERVKLGSGFCLILGGVLGNTGLEGALDNGLLKLLEGRVMVWTFPVFSGLDMFTIVCCLDELISLSLVVGFWLFIDIPSSAAVTLTESLESENPNFWSEKDPWPLHLRWTCASCWYFSLPKRPHSRRISSSFAFSKQPHPLH